MSFAMICTPPGSAGCLIDGISCILCSPVLIDCDAGIPEPIMNIRTPPKLLSYGILKDTPGQFKRYSEEARRLMDITCQSRTHMATRYVPYNPLKPAYPYNLTNNEAESPFLQDYVCDEVSEISLSSSTTNEQEFEVSHQVYAPDPAPGSVSEKAYEPATETASESLSSPCVSSPCVVISESETLEPYEIPTLLPPASALYEPSGIEPAKYALNEGFISTIFDPTNFEHALKYASFVEGSNLASSIHPALIASSCEVPDSEPKNGTCQRSKRFSRTKLVQHKHVLPIFKRKSNKSACPVPPVPVPYSDRKTRVRSCWTCRLAHTRCGSQKPHCRSCKLLGITCGGYAVDSPYNMADSRTAEGLRHLLKLMEFTNELIK